VPLKARSLGDSKNNMADGPRVLALIAASLLFSSSCGRDQPAASGRPAPTGATGIRTSLLNEIKLSINGIAKGPAALTVYVIDPLAAHEPGDQGFHGWRVLKKAAMSNPEEVDHLSTTLVREITAGNVATTCNYRPHRAVRLADMNQSVDFILSYDCGLVDIFVNGRAQGRFLFASTCKPILEAALAEPGPSLPPHAQ
jgi:hypothetical protein